MSRRRQYRLHRERRRRHRGRPADPDAARPCAGTARRGEGERRSNAGIVIPATATMGRRLSWATAVGVGPERPLHRGRRPGAVRPRRPLRGRAARPRLRAAARAGRARRRRRPRRARRHRPVPVGGCCRRLPGCRTGWAAGAVARPVGPGRPADRVSRRPTSGTRQRGDTAPSGAATPVVRRPGT